MRPVICVSALVLLLAATWLFADAAAGLPEGCTRTATEPGAALAMRISCTLAPTDATMRDTYVRRDVPDGSYGSEARLELPLDSQDPKRAGLIYLDWPGLPLLGNAEMTSATIRLSIRESDVAAGSAVTVGVWPTTTAWHETIRWAGRPAPAKPWSTPAGATWTLPATRPVEPTEATWDVRAMLEGRLVDGVLETGFVLGNTTRRAPGVADGPANLRFHSSSAHNEPSLRPTLSFVADLPAPTLRTFTIGSTTLVRDGVYTGAVAATNGTRVERFTVVLDDPANAPTEVVMNVTRADGTARVLTVRLPRMGSTLPPTYTTARALSLPATGYGLTLHAVDPDGYPLNLTSSGTTTSYRLPLRTPTLLVDTIAPRILDVRHPGRVDEAAVGRVSVDVTDSGGALPIQVTANVTVGANHTLHALARGPGDRFEADIRFIHAGNGTIRLRVEDAAGNHVDQTVPVHVVDITPPSMGFVEFLTNLTSSGSPATESTRPVLLRVPTTDTTSVRVVATAAGPITQVFRAPVIDGVALVPIWLNATGAFQVTAEARNADGAARSSPPLGLQVLERAAPRITLDPGLVPGVLPPSPSIRIVVEDASLAPSRIHINVTADGATIVPGVQRAAAPGRLELRVVLGPQLDGTRIRLSIDARDTLGQHAGTASTYTIDATGPDVHLELDGPHLVRAGRTYVLPSTTIRVVAADDLLPVRRPELAVEPVGGTRRVLDATHPITLQAVGTQPVVVQGSAEDIGGNTGVSPLLRLAVDPAGPTVAVVASPTGIRIAARDDGAGLDSLVVSVAIGDEPYGEPLERRFPGAAGIEPPGLLEIDVPTDARRGTPVRVQYTAVDALGNTRVADAAAPLVATVPNHPPAFTIDSPRTGDRITGDLRLHFTVRDLDGDDVVGTVLLERVLDRKTEPGALRVRDSPATIDTTRFLNGPYRLIMTVDDGTAKATDERVVTLANPGRDVILESITTVPDGAIVRMRAAQPLTDVALTVTPPNGPAFIVPMRDDGAGVDQAAGDGVWSALVETGIPGGHSLRVDGRAADGSAVGGDLGTVRAAGLDVTRLVPWLVLGALVVGGIGVGVVLRRRGRR